ncbi:MAG TPA: hypothetical protein VLJ76_09315 [Gaiellaceae bacterium]|nr:hypothetical protein [Gaiellaceae bacterium]
MLTVTNPTSGVVELDWTNLNGPWTIVWVNGYDTVWPNTGHHEVKPAPLGRDSFKVCMPGPRFDICTPTVRLIVR